jgi:dTDP-4-amino-4,6-dideoxygalactose transaminase
LRIGRTLPPAAAPIGWAALWHAATGIFLTRDPAPRLEAEMRDAFGVERVWLVSSGTAALTLTLMALRASSRKADVIIPAYTCFSVPAAVLRAGLRPVPCDIDPATFDFDHALLAKAIGPETLCVVAHDLFGAAADIDGIRALCRAHDVIVVEDAAQGMGVEWQGRPLGTRGDVGIFSLGRGKHLTCGSGGVIVTNSVSIARQVDAQYRQLGRASRAVMARDWMSVALMAIFIRPTLFWLPAGLPWLGLGETIFPTRIRLERLSRMHVRLLRHWRQTLVRSNRLRSDLAARLAFRFALSLPCGPSHPYIRMPVFARTPAERERTLIEGRARGLGFSRGYPSAVSEIPEVRAVIGARRFERACHVAAHLLTVPTHHWVSVRDERAIAACFESKELPEVADARTRVC